MLRFLRTQGKRTKTIWWVLIIVTVVTFLGGFVFILGSGLDSSSRARASGAIGTVNGEPVSSFEYQNSLAQQRSAFVRNYGSEPGERDLKVLEVQAWRSVVLDRLLNEEARKLGIGASDREVVVSLRTNPPQMILQSPSFQTDGKFDVQKYQRAMMDPNNVQEVVRLEQMTRDELPVRKLQERLLSSIKFSEPELAEAFRSRFERVSATVLMIPGAATQPPAASDADLQRIYDKYKDRFTVGARTQVEVLTVPKQLGESEIKVARDLAQSLTDRARRGESFADLARDFSEGPGADQGGVIDRVFSLSDLGPQMAPKLAMLDTGGVSDPMQDGGRFLVMKVLEKTPTATGMPGLKLAQIVVRVRPEPERIQQQVEDLRKLRAQAVKIGLGKAAAAKGMATSMTPFFDANSTPPDLFGVPEAADWAMASKKGEVGPLFVGIDEFVLIQVAGQHPAGTSPKDEVTAQLRQLADVEARVNAAKPKSDQVQAALKQGVPLEQAAASVGISTNRLDGIVRAQPDPQIASTPELVGALFAARPGQVIGPIRGMSGWYFARVEERTPADMALFEQVKSQLSNDLLQNRQRLFLNSYLNELRHKAKVKDLRNEAAL